MLRGSWRLGFRTKQNEAVRDVMVMTYEKANESGLPKLGIRE